MTLPISSETEKGMRYARLEGLFATVMFALTVNFVPALALAMGANKFVIGLLASVPMLFWALNQIPASYLAERTGKRKAICYLGALFSRIMWVPVLLIPYIFSQSLFLLIVFVTFYYFFSGFIVPSWSSLMGDIVPGKSRGRYFSMNNRIFAVASLVASLFAGYMLDLYSGSFTGFTLIFGLGGLFGILSSAAFYKIPEPAVGKIRSSFMRDMKNIFKNKGFKYFAASYVVLNFGVTFAAPFFVVRLLEDLKAPYIWISVLAVTTAVFTIFVQGRWGWLSDTLGNRSIIVMCAFGIAFLPFLWIFAPSPLFLIPVSMMGGIFWGGFNLSSLNYLLGSASERRILFSAVFWTFAGLSSVAGALSGGVVAQYFNSGQLLIFRGLEVVFFISFLLRLAASLLFLRLLVELPGIEKVSVRYMANEFLKPGISFTHNTFRGLRKSQLSLTRGIWKLIRDIRNAEIEIISSLSGVSRRVEREVEREIDKAEDAIVDVETGIIKEERAIKKRLKSYLEKFRRYRRRVESGG